MKENKYANLKMYPTIRPEHIFYHKDHFLYAITRQHICGMLTTINKSTYDSQLLLSLCIKLFRRKIIQKRAHCITGRTSVTRRTPQRAGQHYAVL